MREMVAEKGYTGEDTIDRDDILNWFAAKYPKVKQGTILAHLIQMSTNVPARLHHSPGPDRDLFFRLDPQRFRLFDSTKDPRPIRKDEDLPPSEEEGDATKSEGSQFAYERDLQNFLARNLELLEPNLRLYEDEGVKGLEFPVGGRFVDILATDKSGNYVVIELKVSKGYDRVVGQLLRYMSWIEQNHADPGQRVRGIIVAKTVSNDLRLACARVEGVGLYEYELSVTLKKV